MERVGADLVGIVPCCVRRARSGCKILQRSTKVSAVQFAYHR